MKGQVSSWWQTHGFCSSKVLNQVVEIDPAQSNSWILTDISRENPIYGWCRAFWCRSCCIVWRCSHSYTKVVYSLHILAFYKSCMVLCLYILSVAAFCSSVVQNLIASLVSEFCLCAKIKFTICNLLVLAEVAIMWNFISPFCDCKGRQMTSKFSTVVLFGFLFCQR